MIISSKTNPLIKKIASLAEKKFRKESGEFIVEGVKSVGEAFSAGMPISCVVCTQSFADSFKDPIIVTDELFARISTEKSPQGVLAVVKIPDCGLSAPKGNCLLLDRIQDPGNLGTIIRTANAAGYEDIYLLNCTDAFSPKAIRSSMGGVFYVSLHEGGLEEILTALKGVKIITADMGGEDVFKFVPPEKFCLCIGNEGNGISEEIANSSDFTVKIPMRESCESLNAAVSAAICMYALKNKI